MLKLISVNMEGEKHFPRILKLIATESPDVICLQECPESFQDNLQAVGFTTDFMPMRYQIQNDVAYAEGLVFASKLPFTTSQKHYYQPDRLIAPTPVPTPKPLMHHGYILGIVESAHDIIQIATTHSMVTPDGLPTEHQTQGVKKLLSLLATEKSHVLCGDFNIPRNFNPLYDELTKVYTDMIPLEYPSSLDRSLHRLGKTPALTEPIFDSYVVDYIFSKPDYEVSDVRLQFGISDHAAIIANISKTHVELK